VSGATIPNLIFNLLDESGEIIDSSYSSAVSNSIGLVLTANTAITPFIVSS